MEVTVTSSDVRRRQTGLPPEFARLPMRMVRAVTAAQVYAHPRPELARLTDLGLLHRLATGFYVAVPDDRVGTEWMPGLEAAAAGIAVAAYGADDAVVMGVSAARLHGVIPRALATAVVAVPKRHDPIWLADRQRRWFGSSCATRHVWMRSASIPNWVRCW
jgi:hypothetical protein